METSQMPVASTVPAPQPSKTGLLAVQRDRSLADMKAFLARLSPQSPSEALRLLRNAYPDSPLSLRVAACGLSDR